MEVAVSGWGFCDNGLLWGGALTRPGNGGAGEADRTALIRMGDSAARMRECFSSMR